MTFTHKAQPVYYNYNLDGEVLKRSDSVKDLGVYLQSSFKFNLHFTHIVNKAYRKLGFIIRNSKSFVKTETLKILYNSLVRPHLEYASIIWSPQANCHIDYIERVQKKFLRYLYLRENHVYPYLISYNVMLISFKFQTLVQRRIN